MLSRVMGLTSGHRVVMYAAKQRTCIVCEVAVVNPDRTTVFFASVVPLPSVFLRRESGGYTNYFVLFERDLALLS